MGNKKHSSKSTSGSPDEESKKPKPKKPEDAETRRASKKKSTEKSSEGTKSSRRGSSDEVDNDGKKSAGKKTREVSSVEKKKTQKKKSSDDATESKLSKTEEMIEEMKEQKKKLKKSSTKSSSDSSDELAETPSKKKSKSKDKDKDKDRSISKKAEPIEYNEKVKQWKEKEKAKEREKERQEAELKAKAEEESKKSKPEKSNPVEAFNERKRNSKKEQPEQALEKQSNSEELNEKSLPPGIDKSLYENLSEEEVKIVELLLNRAYHLPGNDWKQDLFQYLTNNHPLFGICCHHPLHPVGRFMRFVALFGSLSFGLAITNIIYLIFVIENKEAFNESYASFELNRNITTGSTEVDDNLTQIDVTNGIIALWTIGAALNALYDNAIWAIASLTCCMAGGYFSFLAEYRRYGPYLVTFLVLFVVVIATLAVLVRATADSNEVDEQNASELELSYTRGAESYRFLIGYSVEIVLSLFIWYPLVGALLFSGVLGCWKIPVLGGRKQEIDAAEKSAEKQQDEIEAIDAEKDMDGTLPIV